MTAATTWTALARRARLRTVAIVVAMAVMLAVCIIAAGADLARHLDAIETTVSGLGPKGVVTFIGLFVVATSLLFPESLLAILAGAAFGLSKGIVVVVTANFLAAAFQFLLARSLLRKFAQPVIRTHPALKAIQEAVRSSGVKFQWLLRLTPLNPATVSYVLSTAGIRFSTFLVSSFALLPHTFVEVYFGYAAKHVTRIAARSPGVTYLHDLVVVGGLILTVLVLLLISKAAHKAVRQVVESATTAGTGTVVT
jgi:uncharacterized membrane protein YdjX (TVP38/TMEM64 family)